MNKSKLAVSIQSEIQNEHYNLIATFNETSFIYKEPTTKTYVNVNYDLQKKIVSIEKTGVYNFTICHDKTKIDKVDGTIKTAEGIFNVDFTVKTVDIKLEQSKIEISYITNEVLTTVIYDWRKKWSLQN
ncbi:MAG: hypothetical protein ACRCUP_03845 [Mycoplasmatales bacterium]